MSCCMSHMKDVITWWRSVSSKLSAREEGKAYFLSLPSTLRTPRAPGYNKLISWNESLECLHMRTICVTGHRHNKLDDIRIEWDEGAGVVQ
jgi:hypothetical protein